MDYVIISKDLRGRLLDVNVLRGAAGGMSDHYFAEGTNHRYINIDMRSRDQGGKSVVYGYDKFRFL